ncbi:MAG TPA: amidase domain-containing protein [Clostridia bacterium]|nr:amidase domain-containing protein [Clostridia bacterium]
MLKEFPYRREQAKKYATTWALARNPAYYSFNGIGGDCSNFVSQCVFAGCGVMNYTPIMGWYYHNAENRSPSWTGVQYLYNFLINNKSVAPFAVEVEEKYVEIGDIVQLGHTNGDFYHSSVVVSTDNNRILVAAHSDDSLYRPISTYKYEKIRFLHILGYRQFV